MGEVWSCVVIGNHVTRNSGYHAFATPTNRFRVAQIVHFHVISFIQTLPEQAVEASGARPRGEGMATGYNSASDEVVQFQPS